MCHVTNEWVMSQINVSCHILMSHITHEYVTSKINEPHHIWMSHVTAEWVMSHMHMSYHICDVAQYHILWRGTFVCDTICVVTSQENSHMSQIWIHHVTHMNASCVTYECVMSHIICVHVFIFVTYVNISLSHNVTYAYVISQITYKWATSHMNESRDSWMGHVTYVYVLSHMWRGTVSHIVTWHICMWHTMWYCDESHLSHYVTYAYVISHITFKCAMSQMHESRHK